MKNVRQPGWYHGEGDPEGTQRYWDGAAWRGEPTSEPSQSEQIFYTEPIDLREGAVNQRQPRRIKTRRKTKSGVSTYRPPTIIPDRRRRLDSGLRGSALLLTLLKALPLIGLLWATRELYNDPGSSDAGRIRRALPNDVAGLQPRQLLLILVLVGSVLLTIQFFGALLDRPGLLTLGAALLTVFDMVNTILALTGPRGFITALPPLAVLLWQGSIAERASRS